MSANDPAGLGVRFGRTTIQAQVGDLTEQTADALVVFTNSRGVMGTGAGGRVRLVGGTDIERLAMAQAPLTLGTAIMTAPGTLADRGVHAIIHGVICEMLGDPVRVDAVRRAIPAALRLADERRFRSVVLPILGNGFDQDDVSGLQIASAIVEEIVAYLRRAKSRIDLITVLARSHQDVAMVADVLRVAREYAWGPPQ